MGLDIHGWLPGTLVMYPPEEPIDWGAYWKMLVEQRKLIGAITAATTLIALVLAFVLPPVYRAEVLLAPVAEDKAEGLGALAGQFGDLAALAGINLGTRKDKTAEYVAALKSRALSLSFIKEANLMPLLYSGKWDEAKKAWKDPGDAPTEWKTFELWDKDIRSVTQDKRTGHVGHGHRCAYTVKHRDRSWGDCENPHCDYRTQEALLG